MDDLFAGRIMSTAIQTVTTETSVSVAAQIMRDHDIGSVVVVDDDGRLEGILTSTDVVRLAADERDSTTATVEEYMSHVVVTTTVNEPIREVAATMVQYGFHHLPVVGEAERVIGMVTTSDVTAFLSHVLPPTLAGEGPGHVD